MLVNINFVFQNPIGQKKKRKFESQDPIKIKTPSARYIPFLFLINRLKHYQLSYVVPTSASLPNTLNNLIAQRIKIVNLQFK